MGSVNDLVVITAKNRAIFFQRITIVVLSLEVATLRRPFTFFEACA
jgi:hypothetical protein